MAQTSTFGETQWAACESVIRRFEGAWREGPRPDVGAYATRGGEHAVRLLVELVHIDLEFRLRAGEYARAEEYRDRFPALADPEHLLDLLAAEFALRHRHCPPVYPEELWLRFPEHQNELRARLPADRTGWWATSTRPAERAGAPLAGPPVVPGYEILGELGRGGMGVVYRARDLLLHREVALKTFATVPRAEHCARFAREAEAIARLDHPNIVPVYEVGEWRAPNDGPAVPYFAMKLYPGGSLDAAPAGPDTDPRAQARTVETIARAVHHAHQRGVLHRDLKPSNILLDSAGRPYVADFGLAGRIESAPETLTAVVAGTPAYMAPEQARAPKSVSTAADVYGLGAILYHQLTGRAPFQADTPLATLEQVAGAPPQRPAELNPTVPRDLETICLKCLEKDPARRYASAAEVADDLERWRTGRPIAARPARAWELAWRRARRHPFVSALVALAALALASAAGVLVYSYREVERKKRETHEAYLRECAMRYKLEDTLRREQRALYLERAAAAGRLYATNQLPEAWALLDACPEAHRGWEWRYLNGLRAAQPAAPAGHTRVVTAVAYLADGRLVSADAGGSARVWGATGRTEREWKCGDTRVAVLAVHPTRDWVAAADHGAITVWQASTGRQLAKLPGAEWVGFSPDGLRLATADGATVRLWVVPDRAPGPAEEPPEWKRYGAIDGHRAAVRTAAFTPDGNILITVSHDGRIRGWSAARGEELFSRPAAATVSALAVVGGGKLLAEAHPGYVLFTEPASGEFRDRLDHPTGPRGAVTASPDGTTVVAAGANGELVLWDTTERRKRVYRGHPGPVLALAVSSAGRVAACGGDEAPRVWDATREPDLRTLAWVGEGVGGIALAPDGARVAIGPRATPPNTDPRAVVLDAASGRELFRPVAFPDVAFHPGTGHLLGSRPGGGASAWDSGTGVELWARPFAAPRAPGTVTPPGGRRLVIAADGSRMAIWDQRAGGVQFYDPTDGTARGVIETGRALVHCIDLAPDGARLAVAAADGLTVWDAAARARAWHSERPATAVAFAPNGELLASADADRTIRLRDAATGRELRALVGSTLVVNALCFSPDGTRLLTGGSDHAVRVWDVETGRELLALPGATGALRGVAWDARTDRVYALDSAVRVWGPSLPAGTPVPAR